MFPDFNIYSTPLLVLVVQGLILTFLLFTKASKLKNVTYALLALILLITCYHRTTYTIGFMGWYDTFRNTKINYYLISLTLAVGPLIYFYIKSCVNRNSHFEKKQLLHFVPALLYVLFFIGVYIYDSSQAGFRETSNGVLVLKMGNTLWILQSILTSVHMFIYLYLSFQIYYKYKASLNHHYSNTFQYEMSWLRNFLYLYSFLFIYDVVQSFTDGFIFDLHWTQEWWFQFFSILVVIYVGVKGYFTSVEELPNISMELDSNRGLSANKDLQKTEADNYAHELEKLRTLMSEEKFYLNPQLTLRSLSQKSGLAPSHLSKIINTAAGQNFNDFVNLYRVEYVKSKLSQEETSKLSILAIALDAGFNSKATFNRVFKKLTGESPSAFRK